MEMRLLEDIGGVEELLDGTLVEWNSVKTQHSMSVLVEGEYLLDLLLVKSGLVYYCKKSLSDQLGTMRYVYYSNPHHHNPILNHEATLWK